MICRFYAYLTVHVYHTPSNLWVWLSIQRERASAGEKERATERERERERERQTDRQIERDRDRERMYLFAIRFKSGKHLEILSRSFICIPMNYISSIVPTLFLVWNHSQILKYGLF